MPTNGKPQTGWDAFSGVNLAYLVDRYEQFRADPAAIDAATREFFEHVGPPPAVDEPATTATSVAPAQQAPAAIDVLKVAGAVALATAIRTHGHRAARLDPLGGAAPGDPSLRPETHGIREEDLAALPSSVVGGPVARYATNALEAVRELQRIYQGPSGYEFEHVSNAEERDWLRASVESGRFCPPNDPIDELAVLERLTDVGSFERFLHTAFPGQTRFSLEGLGMMVLMLDEIIGAAAESGTRAMLLGMAHRGRLNVLAHTLGKPYDQMIGEFMGHYRRSNVSPSGSSDEGWTGDVKYHLGARRAVKGGREVEMIVAMAPNPSHLEWVNPVVEGMTRACDERREQPGPALQDELASLALLIHGDAAFIGQGVVAETLNLSRLPGYRTGGTIHLIANNQLGFTTTPVEGRSTLYASDLAKGFEIPVIHVNADDPEACIAASRLAHAYRERFRRDVLLDLIGYRRRGHNEGDEPAFTQPQMYATIGEHPTVRELWAQELVRRGTITEEQHQEMLQKAVERLQTIRRQLQQEQFPEETNGATSGLEAGGVTGGIGRPGAAPRAETAVPLEELARINDELYGIPEEFHLSPKLERPFTRRRAAFSGSPDEPTVEWAHAEALAFGTILCDGTPIRLTGQDTERGTFSHRHAVLHDMVSGGTYTPLQSLSAAKSSFEVWNAPLSEIATLGFEFGYSVQAPEVLVLWEAQYGDFVNVPQAIIDQFITSAKSKWGQYSAMVMLLPHGYEGQGPEHSSARPERFLQLAAEDNLRIANCTTAAQYFHILRRQRCLLSTDPRPLVLLTPKSLLRLPLAASRPRELAEGRFQPVLDDPVARQHPEAVRRVIFCSGKVFYDLATGREKILGGNGTPPWVSIVRIEELYPFPANDVARIIESYPRLEQVVWLQEEPRNMGAWTYAAPRLRDLLNGRLPLAYVGRTRRSSPAEGSHDWHVREQARIVDAAFAEAAPRMGRLATAEVEHVG